MASDKKSIFLLTPFFSVLGRAGGLFLPFFIALWYGASAEVDAFFLASTLMISLLGFFSPLFESILVPYLVNEKKDPEKISRITNGILLWILPAVLILALALALFLPFLLNLATSLSRDESHLIVRLFLEMIPFLLLGVGVAATNGIFYTHNRFWFPAFSPVIRSGWIILLALLGHQAFGVHALSLGYSIGEIFRWVLSIFLLTKFSQWHSEADWQGEHFDIKNFFSQALLQLLGLFAVSLIPLIDQWCASWFGAGRVAQITYADRLFQIPYQLFLTGWFQIFLADWSETYSSHPPSLFWKRVYKHLFWVTFVSFAISFATFMMRKPLISFLFGYGALSDSDLYTIEHLFGWLMVGFMPGILNLLFARILFVLRKSKIFLWLSIGRLALNLIFNLLFMHFFGLMGIAISTSMVAFATLPLFFWFLNKYSKPHVDGTV
jgi:putative peptidoglycan lipid II flippase